MEDNLKHRGLRKKLVDTIATKGIKDPDVLDAIGRVPRHLFMESYLDTRAYEDRAQPIGSGQTISQPYTVAFQTELLEIKKGDKVLEVGTGSGYQAAVLCEMGAKVYTIERYKELTNRVKELLPKLGYHPHFFYGDGFEGKPTYGPFDKVLITAAAPYIPEKLLEQLKVGGIFVAPVGKGTSQIMTKIRKTGENDYEKEEHGYFVFVPMLSGKVD